MRRIKYRNRVLFSALLLVSFVILLSYSFISIRFKLLENADIVGYESISAFSQRTDYLISSYTVSLNVASSQLRIFIRNNPSDEDIRTWLNNFSYQLDARLKTEGIKTYAVINEHLVRGDASVEEPYHYSTRDWYKGAIAKNGEVYFSHTYDDKSVKKDVFTLSIKLMGSNDVLAIDVYPEVLDKAWTLHNMGTPEPPFYFLGDTEGSLFYATPGFIDNPKELRTFAVDTIKKVMTMSDGTHQFSIILNGQDYSIYYVKEANHNFVSFMVIPYNFLLNKSYSLLREYVFMLIVFVVIIVIMYMNELRLNQSISSFMEVVHMLGNSYFAMYRINLHDGTYEVIETVVDHIDTNIPDKGFYSVLFDYLKLDIEADSVNDFEVNFSFENIRRLSNDNVVDFGGYFQKKFKDEYRWVHIRLIIDKSVTSKYAIICLKDSHKERLKELQHIEFLEDSIKAMEQSNELKMIFYSGISHDMRTPLNGIIGLAELINYNIDKPEKIKDYLQKIQMSGNQLMGLIDTFLEDAKQDNKRREQSKKKVFHIQEDLEKSLNIFRITADKTNKYFDMQFAVEHNYVKGDFDKICNILNNIISNAFKYSREGDSITFYVKEVEHQTQARYQMIVEDTGIGMDKEFLAEIYKPFKQEQRFTRKDSAGVGLGMAIVQNQVRFLNGDIRIESELNKGTKVTVTFPLEIVERNDKHESEVAPAKSKPEKIDLSQCSILIGEDNPVNMQLLVEILKLNGAKNIVSTWDGKEAFETFRASEENTFDIILLDIQMPEMNGCEAASSIRKLDRKDAKNIPIIALSANVFAEDIAASSAAGMNAHISKPINFSVLYNTLKSFLGDKIS